MQAFPRATALLTLALATTVAGAPAVAPTTAMAEAAAKTMTTASGLQITDSQVGTGATPKKGQTCVMHYTGWLYENGAKGKKFDSSVDRGQPFEFPIGTGRVIRRLGRGRRHHEGRRQAHADHSARARLWRARRRRRDSAQRHAAVRGRAPRREGLILADAAPRILNRR